MAHHLRIANAGIVKRQIGDWADTETALDIMRSLDLVQATEKPAITMIAGAPGVGKTTAIQQFCKALGHNAIYIQAARGEGTAWNFAHALANLWAYSARPSFNCQSEAREKLVDYIAPNQTLGAELYVAKDPKSRSQLVAFVGPERAKALGQVTDRLQRRVPLVKPWTAQYLAWKGMWVAEIARTLHTTDVSVRGWLNPKPKPEKYQ